MSEMTRDEGYAYAIRLLSSGDPAYKPRALALQFLTHYEGKRPTDEQVARLADEWLAAIEPPPPAEPPETSKDSVRCIDCQHCPKRPGGFCKAVGRYSRGTGHWRNCEKYAPLPIMPAPPTLPPPKRPTIAQARKRLMAEGLSALVVEHRTIGKQRILRFAPGTTAEQRFAVYRALGLARDSKPLPERKHSRSAPQSAPSTTTGGASGAA